MLTVTPAQSTLFTKLGDFIEEALTVADVPVIQLPVDRAAMPPPSPGFVGMRIMGQSRIMTNLDRWNPQDVNPDAIEIEQAVRLRIQLDCYGAAAGDWAVILSTILRDEYGVSGLAPELAPLYVDEPRFAPLVSGEEQYERRWIVEALMQYNPVVSTPMQFADTAEVTTIEVDERYPPT